MTLRNQVEAAIRNMPDDCNPENPDDLTLPLCEHRADRALARAIESLRKRTSPDIAPRDFIFNNDHLWIELQRLYSLEVISGICRALGDYFDIPACDCGATEDPYLCGGVFVRVLKEMYEAPATH